MSDLAQRLGIALQARYRVERELGQGGMATVFLAGDLKHHRQVAIKVLDPELGSAIGPERFLREIETVAKLHHPHILPLHDSGEAAGLLYYVMPYVTGESLRDRLEREKQLPVEEALHITREVADALGYAHGRGVVHRDVKPANILLENGHALVADFGIARAAAAGAPKMTGTGVVVGTPAYMSPEQAAGGVADARTDVYALGCVLYEMLAGEPPFTGPNAESLVFQHLNAAPPKVTAIRPSAPLALEQAITRAMAKSPADRFATTAEFVAALTAEPRPDGRRRVNWFIPTAVLGLMMALLALSAWQGWWPFGGRAVPPPASKDWILVAEFEGPPGDSTLATAARSLLSAALDQSQMVATVPPEQVRAALAAAGRPRNARVDAELARELAYRSAVRAVLEGTIGRLGKGYSIVLRLVDADTSRVLLTRSGTARNDDALIPALGDMAKQLRQGLGENRRALRATRSMALAATPSFEAYRLFTEAGIRYRVQTANREALRYYRAALAIDPGFASAWYAMVPIYQNLGYPDSAESCFQQALRHPERLTDWQRLRIEFTRASVEGDDRRMVAETDRVLANDPGNISALAWANDALCRLGRVGEALARTRKAMELSPFGPTDGMRLNEGLDLMLLGRFDEARQSCLRMTGIWKLTLLADIEVAAGRFALADSLISRSLDDARTRQDYREGLNPELALARFGRGAADAGAAALEDAIEACRLAHDPAGIEGARMLWTQCSVVSDGALALSPEAATRDTSAVALLVRGLQAAMARDPATARRCLEAARARPRPELAKTGSAPVLLQARLEAMAGRPAEAVRLLRPFVGPVWSGATSLTCVHWWLADAFEQMNRPDSAAFYLARLESTAFGLTEGAQRPYLHRRLAVLQARLGNIREAERHLAAAEQAWDRPDPPVRRLLEEARTVLRAARGMARPERGAS